MNVAKGLRGVLICWIVAGHLKGYTPWGSNLVTNFNTAAFFILTAFTTHSQARNKKINYGTWIIGKWFGIIPLSLLALLMTVPAMYTLSVTVYLKGGFPTHTISVGTQVYLWVMNFLGFSWIGSGGNFSFFHDPVSFSTGSNFGDLGVGLADVFNAQYFSSYLFTMLIGYAGFHFCLSYQIPRKIFQGFSGLVAAVLGVALIVVALWIYQEVNPSSLGMVTNFTGYNIYFFPLFLAGVCLAEVRCHLPRSVKAVLGHWMVVDIFILAFFLYSMVDPVGLVGNAQPLSIVVAVQPVLYCIMILALSCQSYHKKRSVITFTLLERGPFYSFLGKYSYTFYLFQIPLFSLNWMPAFICLGASECTAGLPSALTASISYQLLTVALALVLAVATQWWQDTYVAEAHVALMQFMKRDGSWWALLTHEQNPISGLVLLCYPPPVASSGGLESDSEMVDEV